MLLHGDDHEGGRVAAQFDQAAAVARARWQAHVVEENVAAIAAEHWKSLKVVVDEVRDGILSAINTVEQQIETSDERISHAKAKEIEKHLSSKLNALTDKMQEVILCGINKVDADFCEDANNVMKKLYAEVPVLDIGGDGIDLITPERLVDATLGSMDEGALDKLVRGGVVVAGGLLAGKAATVAIGTAALLVKGGSLAALVAAFPYVGIPAAIGVGAFGAWKWWESIRDGKKVAVIKRLNECRLQVLELETSQGSSVHVSWCELVKQRVDHIGWFFEDQVQEVERIVKSPKEGVNKLSEGLEQTGAAINEVLALEQRLTRVELAIKS